MPPKNFVLTAQINLQGPKNVKAIAASIRNQLKGVAVDVKVNVPPNALRQITALNNQIKGLSGNLNRATAASQGLTSSIARVSTAANSLGGVASNFKTINSSLATTARTTAQQASNFQKVTKSVREAHTEMEVFGDKAALSLKRLAAFTIGTAGIIGLVAAIRNGVKEAIAFDREIVRLAQVTGKSKTELKDLTGEITRLSIEFGVSSKELLGVSSTLAQAGLTARDTRIALEALAKSSLAPSFDDIRQTTEGVIAIMRQFNIQATEVEAALGSINRVSAAYAAEAQDLITAVRVTGGVFASASEGVAKGTDALNQFIAIVTSVRQTTRESAESIATGLRTIFTRIQRPRTIEYLREFGVELTDFEGKFVGPFEAAKRLSEGLANLDNRDLRFAQVTEEIAGYRQLGKAIPLIKQFAVAQEAYAVAQEGSTSLTKDALTAQQALSVQFQKTEERFLALIRSVAQSSTFENLANFALKTADGFIKLGEAIEPIIPFLAILAGAKTLSLGAQFSKGFLGRLGGNGIPSKYKDGGYVPGTGRGDKVSALLEPGEFIIPKDAADQLPSSFLETLRSGKVSKYASGGRVRRYRGKDGKFLPVLQGGIKITPSTGEAYDIERGGYRVGGKFAQRPITPLSGLGGNAIPAGPESFGPDDYARSQFGTVVQPSARTSGIGGTGASISSGPFSAKQVEYLNKALSYFRIELEKTADVQKRTKDIIDKTGVSFSRAAKQAAAESFDVQGALSSGVTPVPTNTTVVQAAAALRRQNPSLSPQQALSRVRRNAGNLTNDDYNDIRSSSSGSGAFGGNSASYGPFPYDGPGRLNSFRGSLRRGAGRLGNAFGGRVGAVGRGIGGRIGSLGVIGAFGAASLANSAIGSETPTRAGISGGITGLAAGATTGGLLAGPAGAVAGGILGAINGVTEGIKQAKLEQELQKLAKSTEQADKVLQAFGSGKAGEGQLNEALGNSLRDANKDSTSLFGKSESDLYGGGLFGAIKNTTDKLTGRTAAEAQIARNKFQEGLISQQLSDRESIGTGAETLFQNRFSRGKFNAGDNTEALRALAYTGSNARTNATTLAQVEGPARVALEKKLGQQRLDQLAKEFQAQNKVSTALETANLNVEILNKSFEQISDNIKRAYTETDKFNITTENLTNSLSGGTQVGRLGSKTDIFTNINAYSNKEVAGQLSGLGASLGIDPSVTGRLGSTILGAKTLQDNLPEHLLQRYQSGASNDDLVGATSRFISDNAPGLPTEFRNQLLSAAEQAAGVNETGSTDFEGFIRGQLSDDISKISNAAIKAATELQKGLEDANATYLAGINQYIQLQLRADERVGENAGRAAGRANQLAQIQGRNLSIDEFAAPEESQIRSLTGGLLNVGDITDRNEGLRGRNATLEARRQQLNELGVDSRKTPEAQREEAKAIQTEQQNIVAEMAKNNGELAKNNKALDLVSNSTGRLAGIQEKLAQLEQQKSAGKGILRDILTADPAQRFQLGKERAALELAKQGKVPGGLAGAGFSRDALAGLDRELSTITDPQERERLETQILNTLAKAQGIQTGLGGNVNNAIDAGRQFETPQQKAERDRAAGVFNQQNAADSAIAANLSRDLPAFLKNLDTQLVTMIKQVGDAANSAFGATGDTTAGFNQRNLDSFANSVNSFNTAIDKMAGTSIKHELAPVNINITHTGLGNLEVGLRPLIKEIVAQQIKNTMPLDARLDAKKGGGVV